ncbi:MAG TPA: methyltransferase domain-containing protein [Desulfobacterales bacterium]|nr:methyltransferase domain-containing protein [Desulfobacterales bacterium]
MKRSRQHRAAEDSERDYVLGTDAGEIERLRIQHEAWRPIVLDAWRRAGVAPGDRALDVGSGPGWAAFDLAEIVGPKGSVCALERSARFVSAGRAFAAERGVQNVSFREVDLMLDAFPAGGFDAAWCRWVCSFVDSPQTLVTKIADALRPGGVAVFHEYADYGSWRFSPALPQVHAHIQAIMTSWREAGGEPDIGMQLLPMVRAAGLQVREVVPRVYCVRPGEPLWLWIATFLRSSFDRLLELQVCGPEHAERAERELAAAERDADTVLLTPLVLEILAER